MAMENHGKVMDFHLQISVGTLLKNCLSRYYDSFSRLDTFPAFTFIALFLHVVIV